MNHTRTRIVAISLLALVGCQSPGSFSGLFGGKASAPSDGRATAGRQETESKQPQSPLASWTNRNSAKDSIDDEMRRARQAQLEGRLNVAQMGYQKVLQLQPENVAALQGLGVIHDLNANYPEAERHYLEALRIAPRDPDLLSNLGYSYSLQGRFPEAEQALQAALEIEPNHRTALYNLGGVYAQQGQFDQALAAFRQGGSEAQAQAALAKFSTPGNNAPVPGTQFASNPSSNLTPPMPPEQMSPATRKLWEEVQKERALQDQQRAAIRNRRPLDSRISAPNPGHRETAGYPPASGAIALTPEQQRQRALEYLRSGKPNPADLNQLFNEIDRNADREQALAEASRLGRGNYNPGPAANFNPGNGTGQAYPSPAEFSRTPASNGMNPSNSMAAAGGQHPAAGLNWSLQQNPAPQQGDNNWNNSVPQTGGSRGNMNPPQITESSGLPEWNPIATTGGFGDGFSPQNVSAARPLSATPTRPRITPGYGSAAGSNSASGSWHGGMNPAPEQPYSGALPPWTPGLQPSSSNSSPAPWQGNTLPVPAGSGQDEFVPMPGQGSGNWGGGQPQTSAIPTHASPIRQVSAELPAQATQRSAASIPPLQNAWERARLEAAQIGLNAGPGTMLPVGQTGGTTVETRSPAPRSLPRHGGLGNSAQSSVSAGAAASSTRSAPPFPVPLSLAVRDWSMARTLRTKCHGLNCCSRRRLNPAVSSTNISSRFCGGRRRPF